MKPDNIFDLPHVFVVFAPGAGGNFIAGVLKKLIDNNLNELAFTSTGSPHTTVQEKQKGIDYMSFGTFNFTQQEFTNQEARINYYLNRIKESECVRQVAWSHDFTNIPLYQKYFPNSKVIVITQTTLNEKLLVSYLHVIRNILDKNVITAFDPKTWEHIRKLWIDSCEDDLLKLTDKNVTGILYNTKYQNLLEYISINKTLSHYSLIEYVNDNSVTDGNQPMRFDRKLYEIKPSDGCIELSFNDIFTYNTENILLTFAKALNTKLSFEQVEYISKNFLRFKTNQNQLMIADPIKYYTELKLRASALIESI